MYSPAEDSTDRTIMSYWVSFKAHSWRNWNFLKKRISFKVALNGQENAARKREN